MWKWGRTINGCKCAIFVICFSEISTQSQTAASQSLDLKKKRENIFNWESVKYFSCVFFLLLLPIFNYCSLFYFCFYLACIFSVFLSISYSFFLSFLFCIFTYYYLFFLLFGFKYIQSNILFFQLNIRDILNKMITTMMTASISTMKKKK